MKKYVIYVERDITGLNPPRFGWSRGWAPPSSDMWEGEPLDSYDSHTECSAVFHGYFRMFKDMDTHVTNAAMMGADADTLKALRSLIPDRNGRPEAPMLEKMKLRKAAMDAIFPVPLRPMRRPLKAVYCPESGALFRSQYEAAVHTGVAASAINAHVRQRAGHGRVRGFTFQEIPGYRGAYTLGRHAEMVAEWGRQRDDPFFGKHLVTAEEALAYRKTAHPDMGRTAEQWVPPEDGKE